MNCVPCRNVLSTLNPGSGRKQAKAAQLLSACQMTRTQKSRMKTTTKQTMIRENVPEGHAWHTDAASPALPHSVLLRAA